MVDYVHSYLLNNMTDWHWDNLSGCFIRIGGLKSIRLHCGFRIKEITIREPFYKCEEIFYMDRRFIKCHRSYIVNLMLVEQFTKTEVTLQNGMVIPISRNNYATFKKVYFRYMFQK